MSDPALPAKRPFLANWLRWFLWIIVFGIGYHGGQLVMIAAHGRPDMGAVIFISGVMGYAIVGVILGAILALLVTMLPQVRLFPTTLAIGSIRVFLLALAFGILSAFATPLPGMSQQSNTAPQANSSSAACFDLYAAGRYQDALAACKARALDYVPRLQRMRDEKDESVVLNDAYDMLRLTNVIALAYDKIGKRENGRQTALHCIGWGLIVIGAVEDLNHASHSSNAAYLAMRSEALKDIQTLDSIYPGVLDEERKAFRESGP
jgi:hypothetical protein